MKLTQIQNELKVPKGNYNSFGIPFDLEFDYGIPTLAELTKKFYENYLEVKL